MGRGVVVSKFVVVDSAGAEAALNAQVATALRLRSDAVKEALYKALHPLVRRTIKWHTVQVQPQPDGTCELVLDALEEDVGFGIGATARWHLKDGFYVTTAAASLRRVPEREGEREGMPQQQLAA